MTVDARDRTLGLSSPWRVLDKLEWELQLLRDLELRAPLPFANETDPLAHPLANLYMGCNIMLTAWSMVDWVWWEIHDSAEQKQLASDMFKAPVRCLADLKTAVRESALELDACHQIANACKHRSLSPSAIRNGFSADAFASIFANEQGAVAMRWSAHPTHVQGDFTSTSTAYSIGRTAHRYWQHMLEVLEIPGQ